VSTWKHGRNFDTDYANSAAPYRLLAGKKFQHLKLETHNLQQPFRLYIFQYFVKKPSSRTVPDLWDSQYYYGNQQFQSFDRTSPGDIQ
jgi:hypothetical protein